MRMVGQWEAARRATVFVGEGDALECGTALSGSTGEGQKPRAAVLMCVRKLGSTHCRWYDDVGSWYFVPWSICINSAFSRDY